MQESIFIFFSISVIGFCCLADCLHNNTQSRWLCHGKLPSGYPRYLTCLSLVYLVISGPAAVSSSALPISSTTPSSHSLPPVSQSSSTQYQNIIIFEPSLPVVVLYTIITALLVTFAESSSIMKLVASSLLLGVASAALAPQQQVLKNTQTTEIPLSGSLESGSDAWNKAKHLFSDSLSGLTAEAQAVWDEVAMHFPDDMEKAFSFPSPKPNHRKPDSAWEYVVKGADIQSVWVENDGGEKEREIDGKLETYNLRAKRVDPSKLGVDKVKQYSGYLDDEENDKHLFYCEFSQSFGLLTAS